MYLSMWLMIKKKQTLLKMTYFIDSHEMIKIEEQLLKRLRRLLLPTLVSQGVL